MDISTSTTLAVGDRVRLCTQSQAAYARVYWGKDGVIVNLWKPSRHGVQRALVSFEAHMAGRQAIRVEHLDRLEPTTTAGAAPALPPGADRLSVASGATHGPRIRALSLNQPWASLMASGAKLIETRSWRPGLALKHGDLLAIHASKSFHLEDKDLCLRPPFSTALQRVGARGPAHLPLGAVVAIAVYDRCVPSDHRAFVEGLSAEERAFGNYAPGRYLWVMREVRRIKPIPQRGAQGLWLWEVPWHLVSFLDGDAPSWAAGFPTTIKTSMASPTAMAEPASKPMQRCATFPRHIEHSWRAGLGGRYEYCATAGCDAVRDLQALGAAATKEL